MRRAIICVLTLLVALVGQTVSAQTRKAPARLLVLTHVTLIDATGAPAKPDMTVVIAGDRITQIGKSGSVSVQGDAQVVDATGKFLIPGLWDMHVHWREKRLLTLFLAKGVTGIRVMWGTSEHHAWRKEMESGALLGPRMFIGSAIIDGPKPFWRGSIGVADAAQARRAVREEFHAGAEFIKVYSSLPRDAFFAIADESKKLGITFAGHIPQAVGAAEASDAGQKSIEHLNNVLLGCSSREEELRRARMAAQLEAEATGLRSARRDRIRTFERDLLNSFSEEKASELFTRFQRNSTWMCPTLTVLRSIAFLDDPRLAADPRLKYVPSSMRENWDPRYDPRFRQWTRQDFAQQKTLYARNVQLLGRLHRVGVGILAGTDTTNPFCLPGFSLHDELELLVIAGLTPLEALQAATLNAARFMGKEKDLGTLEEGKLADLVLLDADPLQDVRNTQKIQAVIFNGRLHARAELDEMLSAAASFARNH